MAIPNNAALDALMEIFEAANHRFLTLSEITEQLQRKGFYRDDLFAPQKVHDHLNYERTAKYPFDMFEFGGDDVAWGLENWHLRKQGHAPKARVRQVEVLPLGREIKHTIREEDIELGAFPLQQVTSDSLLASMHGNQYEHLQIRVRCYGSGQFYCSLDDVHHRLESAMLKQWYIENGITPGDVLWLTVMRVNPLELQIHTSWDRDADAYRRYEQQRSLDQLPRSSLTIRDLVWLYLKRQDQITYWSDIADAVLADRPEVSKHSIPSCLNMNPHLFAHAGTRGFWGLKEWGIDQVAIRIPHKGDDLSVPISRDRPQETHDLDYVLAMIHGEDLVYRILRSVKAPMRYSEITKRISDYLGVNKSVLEHTSYLKVDDPRWTRLRDGRFQLREELEEVTVRQAAKIAEIDQLIETYKIENASLKAELTGVIAQYEQKIDRARTDSDLVAEERVELQSQLDTFQFESESRVNDLKQQLLQRELERDEARHVAFYWYSRCNKLASALRRKQ